MTLRIASLCCILITASCEKSIPPIAAVAEPGYTEVATRWSARTELFVEYPPLVKGQPSRFAIHLTRLDNFQAMRQGTVEVRLAPTNGAAEVFRVASPSRPGIFGVTVVPSSSGSFRLSIHLNCEGIEDTHDLGIVAIPANPSPIKPEASSEDPNEISFLKEQQWNLDFATSLTLDQSLRQSLRVPAEVTPRPGGEAQVDAPFDGRVHFERVPAIGSKVEANQILASLALPTSAPTDPTALELARTEANVQLQYLRRDRERAERLVASGAVPAKRLDEARSNELTAEARLKAAEARLTLFEASRNADSSGNNRRFAIRAPIAGTLVSVKSSPGANVRAGDVLFQIVDLDAVHVSAIIPESEFPSMRGLSGAELEIPGMDAPRRLDRLVTIGRVVDAPSRTFPVIYAFDNRERRVAINQTVYVRILFAPTPRSAVIPESALVEDSGSPIVFVQTSGESFLRRPVKLGQREGGLVQIVEGLKPGERVVTKGAHLIRLASMSSQAPAHGHVH
jgi:cobalt-zinc-cadmium efflux system membrane fusion protein